MTSPRFVSGIQPTGEPHLGTYFGALRDQRAHADDDAWFFVADLHALSAGREPEGIERATLRAAATLLAVGLERSSGALYRQSDVGEILQLQWLLGTVVRLEDLEVDEDVRARRERGAVVSASRAGYSVLMAADVLSLRATHVIVGADQEQHVRMIRQFARALNQRCDQTVVPDDVRRVPDPPRPMVLGRGAVKMSKSAGNGLRLRAERDEVAEYVASLHASGELPLRVEDCVLVDLLRHLDPAAADARMTEYDALRTHPRRVGELREEVVERVDALLAPWRDSYARYATPEGEARITERLAEGAERARALAAETVRAVREGLRTRRAVGRGRPAPDLQQPERLSYSAYVNVPALIASLAPPAESPRGVDPATWPWANYGPSRGDAPEGERPAWERPPLPVDHPHWAHDEVLFIAVHQAFELWFRHALFEIDDLTRRVGRRLEERASESGIEGFAVPHSRMLCRHPEQAARLHFERTLSEHPKLAELVARIEADGPELGEYAVWIRETPRPGVFPSEVAVPPVRLEWVVDLLPLCTERLQRVAMILDRATAFYDVLGRMTPTSFLEFRNRLDPASGFGSSQFRELEIVSGQRERHFTSFGTLDAHGAVVDDALWSLVVAHTDDETEARDIAARAVPVLENALPDDEFQRVRARMLRPTLRDLVDMLLLAGVGDSPRRRQLADRVAAGNFGELYDTGKRRRAHGFAHTHGEREMWRTVGAQLSHMESIAATAVLADDPAFASRDLDDAGRREFGRLLDACMTLDRALMGWRVEHLAFVESVIGARPGTGGGGLVYLQETMKATRADYVLRSFPAVWAARSLISL